MTKQVFNVTITLQELLSCMTDDSKDNLMDLVRDKIQDEIQYPENYVDSWDISEDPEINVIYEIKEE